MFFRISQRWVPCFGNQQLCVRLVESNLAKYGTDGIEKKRIFGVSPIQLMGKNDQVSDVSDKSIDK